MDPLGVAIKRRVANVAIGPSAVRKQGRPGVARQIRAFLSILPLRPFGTSSAAGFRRALDEATDQLASELSPKAPNWGLARKCLNIFLRDAFYNAYLRMEFDLEKSEKFYEVPLDSVTARALRLDAGRRVLPAWPGVKGLQKPDSDKYQHHALKLAARMGIARVHLDTYLWSPGLRSARPEQGVPSDGIGPGNCRGTEGT